MATLPFALRFQGCYTQEDTYEETLENIKNAIHLHTEDRVSEMPIFIGKR